MIISRVIAFLREVSDLRKPVLSNWIEVTTGSFILHTLGGGRMDASASTAIRNAEDRRTRVHP
jgi:hypothetical protein